MFILASPPPDCRLIPARWEHLRWTALAPARLDVRRSGAAELECRATGSPAPAIAWYREGEFTPHPELNNDNNNGLGETVARLRLPCASEQTAGRYECRARAGRQELSAVTEVRVAEWDGGDLCRESGRPEIGIWSPTLMVEEGQMAVLPCRPMQSGLDHVTAWTNDRGEVLGSTGERHAVTAEGDLVVRDVSFLDMGTYTCTLSNASGADSTKTFLYPLAPGISL
jgi:hypothetical protein